MELKDNLQLHDFYFEGILYGSIILPAGLNVLLEGNFAEDNLRRLTRDA